MENQREIFFASNAYLWHCCWSCFLFCQLLALLLAKNKDPRFFFFLLFASNVGNGSDATAAAADDDNVIASCRRKSCGRTCSFGSHPLNRSRKVLNKQYLNG